MSKQLGSVVRVATARDRDDFYRLWKVCFGDSDAFCDWFFKNRFLPEYSVCLETEQGIASCMQAYPYTFWIREKEISGAMLCGVSTAPEQRKKGFMGQIFRYEMHHLAEKGCLIAPHTPAVLESYFPFGHFPVADATYLAGRDIPHVVRPKEIVSVDFSQIAALYPLYERFAKKYSGMLKRTEADFQRKAADYATDNGQCIVYIEKGQPKAYAFYYKLKERLVCIEAVAEDGYWQPLMEGLFAEAEGCAFLAKLPPELEICFPFAQTVRKPKGVMGLCNATALLRALELKIPYSVRIKDAVIEKNNGCFLFSGERTDEKPVFEISAGHFLQALVGYRSLDELRDEIMILDEDKFQEIDRLLPKQHCYIIDEY